ANLDRHGALLVTDAQRSNARSATAQSNGDCSGKYAAGSAAAASKDPCSPVLSASARRRNFSSPPPGGCNEGKQNGEDKDAAGSRRDAAYCDTKRVVAVAQRGDASDLAARGAAVSRPHRPPLRRRHP